MKKLLAFLLLLSFAACKDRYDIPLHDSDQSLLVVEGFLALGADTTIITLSRTAKVNEAIKFSPVLKANLTVEGKSGSAIPLQETGGGKYFSKQLGLVAGNEYRLRIQTSDNKVYLSDYIVAKQTPELDSVSWRKENNNMVIYANTHDANNSTKYYKWDYDETWEIRSHYAATYEYTGGTTIVYAPFLFNYRCWKYDGSKTINVGSSAHLSSDVISEAPIQLIPAGSEKLSVRYSILVRQQSLTREAYDYFQLMKKNTESIGSIFDPLPSELKGNIHCISNPGEGVIGYLTASSITRKRIFITSIEANWKFTEDCLQVERVKNNPDSIKLWVPGFLPWGAEEVVPGVPLYFYMSPAYCVDCTKRGGNLAMPSYW
jgi:hypothetical protein